MAGQNTTRADVAEQLAEKIAIRYQLAGEILEQFLEEISKGLIEDGCVKLSSFGSFLVRNKNNRIGRNPKTGQEAVITSRRTVSFRASPILKQKIAKMQKISGQYLKP